MPRTVAHVCVDSAMPHLDRPFDYAIPAKLAGVVAVGSRVRVRFAGRLINGVVTAISDSSTFDGTLAPVHSAGGAPSYTPESIAFAGAVARRYGGALWDVLRLMAPPRVAAIESRAWGSGTPDDALLAAAAGALAPEAAAVGLPAQLLARGARLVWDAIPAADRSRGLPIEALLAAAVDVAAHGQSAVVVLPDARAVAAAHGALTGVGLRRWTTRSGGDFTVLQAEDGAQSRYASYLAAMHGEVRLVIGTRAAVLQPVPALGLLVLWDDGAPIYDEPHAPYPHARTLAAMRADEAGAGMVIAGYAPSVDAMALVAHGWAERAVTDRALVRSAAPHIDPLDGERRAVEGASGWHWMPGSAWRRARAALERGPVGIVVPRAGYVRATACARCDAWAECPACGGALRRDSATAPLRCGDCGAEHPDWHCPACQGRATKQLRQGVERIAEQVRAMAGETPVAVSSGAVGTLADGAVDAGLVVATPAALPAVAGGYACIVIVGADVPAGGGLGAEIQALRWWLGIAALARPRGEGGEVIAVGDLPPAVRSALVSWSAGDAARDAYAERADLGLPPFRRSIRLWGPPASITLALSVTVEGERIERHRDVTVVEAPDGASLLVTRRVAAAVVDALRQRQIELSRTGEGELRLRVDAPLDLR